MTAHDPGDEVFAAALEDYAAHMTPADFRAFTFRVRPPAEGRDVLRQVAADARPQKEFSTCQRP
jgi:hypothetical protein